MQSSRKMNRYSINNASNIVTNTKTFVVFIPAKAFASDYVITGVSLSVCLSVCLFVTTITK